MNVLNQLRIILQEVGDGTTQPGTIEQKLGDFYAVAMDSAKATKEGIHPLDGELAKIEA